MCYVSITLFSSTPRLLICFATAIRGHVGFEGDDGHERRGVGGVSGQDVSSRYCQGIIKELELLGRPV